MRSQSGLRRTSRGIFAGCDLKDSHGQLTKGDRNLAIRSHRERKEEWPRVVVGEEEETKSCRTGGEFVYFGCPRFSHCEISAWSLAPLLAGSASPPPSDIWIGTLLPSTQILQRITIKDDQTTVQGVAQIAYEVDEQNEICSGITYSTSSLVFINFTVLQRQRAVFIELETAQSNTAAYAHRCYLCLRQYLNPKYTSLSCSNAGPLQQRPERQLNL